MQIFWYTCNIFHSVNFYILYISLNLRGNLKTSRKFYHSLYNIQKHLSVNIYLSKTKQQIQKIKLLKQVVA